MFYQRRKLCPHFMVRQTVAEKRQGRTFPLLFPCPPWTTCSDSLLWSSIHHPANHPSTAMIRCSIPNYLTHYDTLLCDQAKALAKIHALQNALIKFSSETSSSNLRLHTLFTVQTVTRMEFNYLSHLKKIAISWTFNKVSTDFIWVKGRESASKILLR